MIVDTKRRRLISKMMIWKNTIKYIVYVFLFMLPLFSITNVNAIGIDGVDINQDGQIDVDNRVDVEIASDNQTRADQINEMFSKNKWLMSFFVGGCTIIMGAVWVFKIYQFASSGSEASNRQKAMSSLIVLGIATAMLTGATFFITFANGLFNF